MLESICTIDCPCPTILSKSMDVVTFKLLISHFFLFSRLIVCTDISSETTAIYAPFSTPAFLRHMLPSTSVVASVLLEVIWFRVDVANVVLKDCFQTFSLSFSDRFPQFHFSYTRCYSFQNNYWWLWFEIIRSLTYVQNLPRFHNY